MSKTIEKKQFTLQGRDWAKTVGIGIAVAALTALWELYEASGSINSMSWDDVIKAVFAAAIAYLGKNFLEKSKVVTVEELPKK